MKKSDKQKQGGKEQLIDVIKWPPAAMIPGMMLGFLVPLTRVGMRQNMMDMEKADGQVSSMLSHVRGRLCKQPISDIMLCMFAPSGIYCMIISDNDRTSAASAFVLLVVSIAFVRLCCA